MAKLFKLSKSKDASWFFRVQENGKRVRICTHTADKRLAADIRDTHLANRARVRSGIASDDDLTLAKHAAALISEEVEAWARSLVDCSEVHVRDSKRAVNRLADFGGWEFIRDISEDDLNRWMSDQSAKDVSSRTIQKYGRALKQFSKWLADSSKLARDPLRRVKLPSPESNRKKRRRMLLPTEWTWIEKSLRSPTAPVRFGMSAIERLYLYQFAIETGLRSKEIRTVKHCDLIITKDSCYVTKLASETKNAEQAKQFISRPLADVLKGFKSESVNDPIFRMPRGESCAKMLYRDLASARALWIADESNESKRKQRSKDKFLQPTNDANQELDFHALRHTCGAWLAEKGVSIKVIQKIMRHSTITLTLDTYGHLMPGSEQEAIEKLSNVFEVANSEPLNVRIMCSNGNT